MLICSFSKLDCSFSKQICHTKSNNKVNVVSFDIDSDAILAAKNRLKDYNNLTIVKSSYVNIKNVLAELGINEITGGIIECGTAVVRGGLR